ncbi:hypothetical protein IEQ34_000369 [Dendrobium chrysotoxum]|uniref:Homeobox domain-containing protein n=1 Tax=Dendrobium chrysotoxum TaxID=161865 RepID=A0AAV7HPP5_DENCH|nr:hypothetical protein IEQ34_000369 [Dendrobium chrysotoxum]
MPQVPSTRWCPTPEQLMILEEMYRSGVRTPNASQIQQITSHLSFYGKIEGKNVFYWFQNHKARDRQKLRRRLSRQQVQVASASLPPHPPPQFFPHLYQPHNPQFFHQGGGFQEPRQGLDLLRKLETCSSRDEASPSGSSSLMYGCEWTAMIREPNSGESSMCCHSLKTLELFPTKSTGLKEESSTSKSSCSASTN